MGMGGGGKQTTQETKEIRLPPWVEQASMENYQRAKDVANRPYAENPYMWQMADLDPLYYAARKDTGKLDDAYGWYDQAKSGLTSLLSYNPADIAASSVQARPLSGTDLAPYMNPFINSVEARAIDAASREGLQQQTKAAADATASKAFGGSRQALQQGVAQAETARKIGDLSAGLRKQAFDQAQQAAVGDITREYEAAKQTGEWQQAAQIASRDDDLAANQNRVLAAQQMGELADKRQNAIMNTIAQKLGIGQIAQEQAQAKLDKKSGKWQTKRDYPLEQLNILMAALGMSPYGHTETGTSTTRSSGGGGSGILGALGMGAKLLSGFMGMSDPDTKTNIEPAGTGPGGIPMFAYDYKADVKAAKKSGKPMPPKRVGPMAGKGAPRLGGKRGRKVIDLTSLSAA